MPNRNYINGRNKEYRIRKKLIEEGCEIAQRSAGSHSPIDVFGINKKKREIVLVQVKPKGYNKKDYDEYKWLNGKFKIKFEIR